MYKKMWLTWEVWAVFTFVQTAHFLQWNQDLVWKRKEKALAWAGGAEGWVGLTGLMTSVRLGSFTKPVQLDGWEPGFWSWNE